MTEIDSFKADALFLLCCSIKNGASPIFLAFINNKLIKIYISSNPPPPPPATCL